jgi:hypothetical protein
MKLVKYCSVKAEAGNQQLFEARVIYVWMGAHSVKRASCYIAVFTFINIRDRTTCKLMTLPCSMPNRPSHILQRRAL